MESQQKTQLSEIIYAAVRHIPRGKTATYSQIAALAGNRNLRRYVGNVLHKNPDNSFNSIFDLTESDISLLPLISWLRNNDNKERSDFSYFYDKALLTYRGLGGN